MAAGGPAAADLIGLIPTEALQSSLQQHINGESVSQIIGNIQDALYGEPSALRSLRWRRSEAAQLQA